MSTSAKKRSCHYIEFNWASNSGYQISPDRKQLLLAACEGLNQTLFMKTLASSVVQDFLARCLGGRSAGFDFFELANYVF